MPAITFFALFAEGNRIETLIKRWELRVADYPHLEKDDKEETVKLLQLPEDVFGDILEEGDDAATLKEAFKDL